MTANSEDSCYWHKRHSGFHQCNYLLSCSCQKWQWGCFSLWFLLCLFLFFNIFSHLVQEADCILCPPFLGLGQHAFHLQIGISSARAERQVQGWEQSSILAQTWVYQRISTSTWHQITLTIKHTLCCRTVIRNSYLLHFYSYDFLFHALWLHFPQAEWKA